MKGSSTLLGLSSDVGGRRTVLASGYAGGLCSRDHSGSGENKMNALLVDRSCAILDGKCNCPRYGEGLPFCKYGTSNALVLKKAQDNKNLHKGMEVPKE